MLLHEEVPCDDGRVLGLLVFGETLHARIFVKIVKESYGLATAPATALGGVDDLVQGGLPGVVSPSTHEVSEVDHEGVLHEGHVCPRGGIAVLTHLQTRAWGNSHYQNLAMRLVFKYHTSAAEDGDHSVVGVGAGSQLAR